ncbi:MAG: hypothetical protein HGA85_01420 [Nanoarchaeota archaeon]|nr:hypothetical protein [Nanoarchaeota archaeon]
MKKLIIGIVVILIIGYLALTLMGFTGLSRPKDLGVRYTDADLASLQAKAPYRTEYAEGDKTLVYSGKMEVKDSFTSEEITARLNSNQWKYNTMTDTQVRINPDGTAEISGKIKKAFVDETLDAFKVNIDKDILDKATMLPADPVYYAKGKVTIIDNKISGDVEELKIGSFDIPKDQIPKGRIISVFEKALADVPNLDIRKMEFVDGKMNLDATSPQVVTVGK